MQENKAKYTCLNWYRFCSGLGQEPTMSQARYLPASHTQARSLPLGPLTIRTADDRELGRLMGFVIGPDENHISRLVLEVDGARQVALPMVPLRFDVDAQALRLTSAEIPLMSAFEASSIAQIDEADLWVPLVSSAA